MNAIVDGRPTGRDVKQARALPTSAGRKASPILSAIDHLITNQDNRHAWLYAAGAQLREMNRREAEGDNFETEDER